jgi:glycosyltransferase involved in cell wall biosynthesis
MPVLHVAVPVYNELETLEPCLRRVLAARLPAGWSRDLYLVDDHSRDDAYRAAEALARRLQEEGHAVSLHRHEVNRGKGAALQTAFDAILESGADDPDLVIIQDADLEYDPDDFSKLMEPIIAGRTRAVIGTRWGAHREPGGLIRTIHAWGNGVLTWLSNLMTGYRVSDMECCYKLLTLGVLRQVRPMLSEVRFGIEPQLVASLARLREPIVEVPISYAPRGRGAGKKIGLRDAMRAIVVIARERLRGPLRPPLAAGRRRESRGE